MIGVEITGGARRCFGIPQLELFYSAAWACGAIIWPIHAQLSSARDATCGDAHSLSSFSGCAILGSDD
jgi:hypothetical protein